MKFLQYINETELQHMSPQEIVATLKRDCKPVLRWIKKNNYKKFMRRFNHNRGGTNFILLTSRKDRKPVDTPDWVQKMLDDAFEKKFGVRPRSGGVFCKLITLQEFSFPMDYNTFILFPVGNYKGIWSSDISDLYLKWTNDISDMYDKQRERKAETKKWVEGIVNMYSDDDLNKVVYYQEIMLMCDKYYMVNGPIFESVLKELKK